MEILKWSLSVSKCKCTWVKVLQMYWSGNNQQFYIVAVELLGQHRELFQRQRKSTDFHPVLYSLLLKLHTQYLSTLCETKSSLFYVFSILTRLPETFRDSLLLSSFEHILQCFIESKESEMLLWLNRDNSWKVFFLNSSLIRVYDTSNFVLHCDDSNMLAMRYQHVWT